MAQQQTTVAVLGASGLVGEAIASALLRDGFAVVPIARRFTASQKSLFGPAAVECPLVEPGANALAAVISAQSIDVVVNCVGVLQDGVRGNIDDVHRIFVQDLLALLRAGPSARLLVHISIPGDSKDDHTNFSRTKRAAESLIASASVPFVILRPAFVVAVAAYGGSALIRALAALPVWLSAHESARPFAVTDVADIARTIAVVTRRWTQGERTWRATWDVMACEQTAVGEVVEVFRRHFGGPRPRVMLPSWLMSLGAAAGDLASIAGWRPPIRSTALYEMRRGVTGDPAPWMAATGLVPASLGEILRNLPATVQEKWFARLYLIKAFVLAALVGFWVISGLIALTVAFDAANAILTAHGWPPAPARAVTVVSSLADISVGVAIAIRKSSRMGLWAGVVLSIGYMLGATVLTPELWVEPLGALVKTGPAIVLMMVALAIAEER